MNVSALSGKALILAGGMFELNQRIQTRAVANPGGYEPVTKANQTVEVSTVIFDDGSFEGEVEPAVAFRGFVKGRKLQLSRLVSLLQTREPNDLSPAEVVEQLQNQAARLETDADSVEFQEALSEFPGLRPELTKNLKIAIQIAMVSLRKDLLNEIDRLRVSKLHLNGDYLNAWRDDLAKRYQEWLSRL